MAEVLHIRTSSRTDFVDITQAVENLVRKAGVGDGICFIFVPHTTAGLTINENADPSVKEDIIMQLSKIVPVDHGYRHREGNSAAHIKASLVGFSQSIPVESGRLLLGTWQGIYLCEFDGPRERQVLVSFASFGRE